MKRFLEIPLDIDVYPLLEIREIALFPFQTPNLMIMDLENKTGMTIETCGQKIEPHLVKRLVVNPKHIRDVHQIPWSMPCGRSGILEIRSKDEWSGSLLNAFELSSQDDKIQINVESVDNHQVQVHLFRLVGESIDDVKTFENTVVHEVAFGSPLTLTCSIDDKGFYLSVAIIDATQIQFSNILKIH